MSDLNTLEVKFLRDLVAARHPDRRAGPTALALLRDHSLGKQVGQRVVYEQRDYTTAQHMLINREHGLTASAPGGRRRDAAAGGSEKTGAGHVTEHLVAVVPLHMGVAPAAGVLYHAADWRRIDLASFDLVLEVENLEVFSFAELAGFSWLEDLYLRGRRTLAVFRGMPGAGGPGTGTAAGLIRESAKPVLGFYDFDPEGLVIAGSEPRLEALCLPPADALEAAVARYRRTHLFTGQVHHRRAALDALGPGPVRDAWLLLRELQCGLPQENFPR